MINDRVVSDGYSRNFPHWVEGDGQVARIHVELYIGVCMKRSLIY